MIDYYISYDGIIADTSAHPEIRMLAMAIKAGNVVTVADAMKLFSGEFISKILKEAENQTIDGDLDVLISGMLMAQAEGEYIPDYQTESGMDEVQRIYNTTLNLFAVELLHRNGLVDLKRENMTYDIGSNDKPLVAISKLGREIVAQKKGESE